jgi:multimeric flavodoxin WrbA
MASSSAPEPGLTAVALNCTLKRSGGEPSSTDVLLDQVDDELRTHGVATHRIRVADHDVRPGVTSDEGDGDAWPAIRQRVLDADLLVLATPIWLGHPSSIAQRVLERLDAFLGEKDNEGRLISVPRVAMVAVVGNEDGAHHVGAELYQGLNDVGFTLAAEAMTYWVGEAMQGTDYKDLANPPDAVVDSTATMVRNAVHLATLLQASNYPPPP